MQYPQWFWNKLEERKQDNSNNEECIEDEILMKTDWIPLKGNVAEKLAAFIEVAMLT